MHDNRHLYTCVRCNGLYTNESRNEKGVCYLYLSNKALAYWEKVSLIFLLICLLVGLYAFN